MKLLLPKSDLEHFNFTATGEWWIITIMSFHNIRHDYQLALRDQHTYTLSHLENDCDVSAHSRGRRLSLRAKPLRLLTR